MNHCVKKKNTVFMCGWREYEDTSMYLCINKKKVGWGKVKGERIQNSKGWRRVILRRSILKNSNTTIRKHLLCIVCPKRNKNSCEENYTLPFLIGWHAFLVGQFQFVKEFYKNLEERGKKKKIFSNLFSDLKSN